MWRPAVRGDGAGCSDYAGSREVRSKKSENGAELSGLGFSLALFRWQQDYAYRYKTTVMMLPTVCQASSGQ